MTEPDTITYIREQYLTQIHSITGRNVIAYYFGWLKTSDAPHVSIDEQDKNAFMTTVYKLDKDRKSTRLNSSHVALSRMPSSA